MKWCHFTWACCYKFKLHSLFKVDSLTSYWHEYNFSNAKDLEFLFCHIKLHINHLKFCWKLPGKPRKLLEFHSSKVLRTLIWIYLYMSSFFPHFSNFVLICPFFYGKNVPVCPFLLLKIVLFSFEDNPKLEWEPWSRFIKVIKLSKNDDF